MLKIRAQFLIQISIKIYHTFFNVKMFTVCKKNTEANVYQ